MDIFSPFIFEIVMLLCFGCSWPFAITKTIRTQSVEGLSIWFISLVFIGYLAGIFYKLIAHFDSIIWLYIINGSLIFTQILLYFRYRHVKTHSAVLPDVCIVSAAVQSNITRKGETYGSSS